MGPFTNLSFIIRLPDMQKAGSVARFDCCRFCCCFCLPLSPSPFLRLLPLLLPTSRRHTRHFCRRRPLSQLLGHGHDEKKREGRDVDVGADEKRPKSQPNYPITIKPSTVDGNPGSIFFTEFYSATLSTNDAAF